MRRKSETRGGRDTADPHAFLRRRAVADLLVQGERLGTREIAQRIAESRAGRDGTIEPGIRNPRTGAPYGHATIARDIRWLQERWREESMRDLLEHKAAMLAHLKHLYYLAMQDEDYSLARRVLRDITDLLGLDHPDVIVAEQMERAVDEAMSRLEQVFGRDPELLELIFQTLTDTGEV